MSETLAIVIESFDKVFHQGKFHQSKGGGEIIFILSPKGLFIVLL